MKRQLLRFLTRLKASYTLSSDVAFWSVLLLSVRNVTSADNQVGAFTEI
ncbi:MULTISPECIES: hypothetical protein [unclassified Brevibacterium]|nr:hypothetical protein [Brevibacterium sp. S22]